MNQNCMNGTSNEATSSEILKMSVMAHGKLSRKSWDIPVMINRNGKNVILMASVAEKMERKKWVLLCMEACQRDIPSPISPGNYR